MRKLVLCITTTLLLSITLTAQINFERGYFIKENNEKVECLIKNEDWKNNPTNFEYRLNSSSQVLKNNIASVKEFGVLGKSKYVRDYVEIDRSSENIRKLTSLKNAILYKEKLFLKVIIEGKASLYSYNDGSLQRFFYKINNEDIKQLIYKKYKASTNKIGSNERYKQQLLTDLKCQDINLGKIENLNYNRSDLVRLFTTYNICSNSENTNYTNKDSYDFFNLNVRPRLRSSSLTVSNSVLPSRNTMFDRKLSFGIGLEAELVLPFNKNKWSLILEPTYQRYKNSVTKSADIINGGTITATVDYSSLEIPVGIRHYLFLNDNSKFFLNGSLILDISSESSIIYTRSDGSFLESIPVADATGNLAIGLGYVYNNRYSVEIRYQLDRDILGDYRSWNSGYNTTAIIIGYSIF